MLKTVAAATACAVVALVGPAAAHERHGVAKGYVSTVSAIQPNVLGLSAFVVGGDDRLLLRNLSPRVIVIRGYDGEPYLRFSPDGVYENVRSPATYLNRFRFPRGDPPASADPTASPEWRRITTANNTSWHDHRIHWMRGEPPPVVAAAPRRSHRIFDWRVPGTADGKPFAVTGFLGYSPASPAATATAPSDDGDASWAIPVAVAGGGLALLALLYRLRRKA